MTHNLQRIGWLVMALLFAAGCAPPSRANAPSAGEDSTAVQKVILVQPAGEEEELKLKPVDPLTWRISPVTSPFVPGPISTGRSARTGESWPSWPGRPLILRRAFCGSST